ncbi:hypothetical protein C8J57DRAFT_1444990 [Mycena rebaudengoi]|nr:hypothetical protein C8J57DRAFT_1444990 [Mycena rebaudengoi]
MSYPSQLFDGLTSLEAVEEALLKLELLIHVNPAVAEDILGHLLVHERPEVVRLVLAYINEDVILSRFPSTPNTFKTSLAHKILHQLSLFFQSTPSSVIDTPDEERALDERADERRVYFRHLVKDAPELIDALLPRLLHGESEHGLVPQRKMSQKKMKQARREAAKLRTPLDPAAFERLDIEVPETREEIEEALRVIMDSEEAVLEIYMDALREPILALSLRTACVQEQPVLPPTFEPEHTPTEVLAPVVALVPQSPTSAYNILQPMKFATLYCQNAAGFGEWVINIAPRGERDLREHKRRDRKIFAIIVKKIKELSNGHFSPDNQKRLNNSHVDIPIYEAKMTGDLRLIYQIDCVPSYDSNSERQAIKIFGIYTHAQLGRVSFWDSMGRELGKKGKEYKERCAFRRSPRHAGDHVFSPSTFPVMDEPRALPPGGVPDLPPDDLEQIQNLLLKSMHFSQPLLDSIVGDLDVAFVLQVSPREQAIIEHPSSCYVLGRSGTGKTTTMLYKMLLVETDYELSKDAEGTPKRWQLFVTQSRILAEKVEEHFGKLFAGYRPGGAGPGKAAAKTKTVTDALVDADDELNWRSDLPTKYSDLKDEHFPLFITFDRLCTMIENDMAGEDPSALPSTSASGRATGPTRLTYDKFLQNYWPHFPQSLSKGLDPSLVFSEFMGVIMGSGDTLVGDSTCLDRDKYLNLSERAQSTFADQRERIYSLFESYLSQKRMSRDIDGADRTHAILRYLGRRGGIPGRKMDYLYVDETQDNLLIDTLLLRSICHNANGLFWAGDTAQTISVGSSFRFNELKAFLYRIEQKRYHKNSRAELFYLPPEQPRMFQLTVNYRSHAGIVNCAHTVIEVITLLWPYAIDMLDRERGTVDGLRPVFFTGFDSGNVQYEQFLFGDRAGSYIEFGAQQCILVRDEAAREKLREQVGDIGLIMTLYESKGLEFNDVLLYNFFEDSTVGEAQWRVVLNAVKNSPAPRFDSFRHAGVCVELKFLYVAITRARNNVWIADTSVRGEPMRALWTSRDQVQNCTPGTDTPRLAISSTAEEWEEQGRKLFANKRYRQAKHCFERALRPRQVAMADAYYLRQEARKSPGGNSRRAIDARRAAFLEAAAAFLDCAREDKTFAYFRIAAECFEDAGDDLQAAQAYQDAREFTRSAELWRKLGRFDEAVAIVKAHKKEVRPDVVDKVVNVARLFYFKEQKFEKANELFSSYEEELEYLEDRGLDVAQATLLESLGRFAEAAELHLEEGRTFEAIKLFLQDQTTESSMRRGMECVLQGLWQRISFAIVPEDEDSSISRLLTLASKADVSLLSQTERDEISMFQAIVDKQHYKLERLGQAFYETGNKAVALLCLDHCFSGPPKIQALQAGDVAENLKIFHTYVSVLHDFAFVVDPCDSGAAEKLFGYTRQGENNWLATYGTFLHTALHQFKHPASRRSTEEKESILLAGSELRTIIYQTLAGRLKQRVRQENEMCKRAKAFSPCVVYALNGQCNRFDCPQEHLPAAGINREQYNTRIRIHLQQILIYQTIQSIDNESTLVRRYWLSQLYAALNPTYYILGTASSLDPESIPEAEEGFQVVREWARSWIGTLDFLPSLSFLSHLAEVSSLSLLFDRKHSMEYLMWGLYMQMKPTIYLRPGGNYVVGEFIKSLELKESWSLSAGIFFIQHIVHSQLPIQINVVLDLSEQLATYLIISHRRRYGHVHDVTLPLSWLAKWSTSQMGDNFLDSSYGWNLAQSLSRLLEPIYSGVDGDFLLHHTRRMQHVHFTVKNFFIARICRLICLLAYNYRNERIQKSVLKSMTDLRKGDRRFSSLYAQYVHADSWSAVLRPMRSSTSGSRMDEMVRLLCAKNMTKAFNPLRHVRQIVYKDPEEIPRLLGTSGSLSNAASGPESLVSADSQTDLAQGEDDAAAPEEEDIDAAAPETKEDEDEALPEAVPDDVPPVLEAAERSEEEVRAAGRIQRAFKRVRVRTDRRRAEMAESSVGAACADLFLSCLKEAATMEWPNHEYRLRFLGPLPHLLLCLDIVHNSAQKQKKQIKKDLRDAKHEKLEELDKRLTQVTNALKQIIAMQKALGPKGTMHLTHDLASLKQHTSKAVELMRSLPFKTPEDLTPHLDRAYKGIVQVRVFVPAQQPSERKPVLNMEDSEDYYY